MIKLRVMVTLPDRKRLYCGDMITTTPDSRGFIQGAFRYTPEYLENPFAFPLDPVNLPLSSKEFIADRPTGIHAVFEDSLPEYRQQKTPYAKAV
jgi:serine/threonine-protein kinase HipA